MAASRLDKLFRAAAGPRFEALQGAIQDLSSTTLSQLAASSGPALDHLYARIGALNGPFFPRGWGNLSVVNYDEDLKHLVAAPPASIRLDWRLVERGNREGVDYMLYEGSFRTPCLQRVYDALPPESRTGRVQLLIPAKMRPFHPLLQPGQDPLLQPPPAGGSGGGSWQQHHHLQQQQQSQQQHSFMPYDQWRGDSAGAAAVADALHWQRGPGTAAAAAAAAAAAKSAADAPACVIHLAATGDQTFGRRLRLGFPLLKDNICSLVLESPFYGARRPAAQRGSKLLRVSDLLTLGWATIAESVNLLHWLRAEGYGPLGMCGLSMGGVHACMTAGLYPGDVAVTPLLAPRSAAVAYCDGAMRAVMAWEPLLKEVDENNNHVLQVVKAAGRAVAVSLPARGAGAASAAAPAHAGAYGGGGVALMREATYALADLELQAEGRGMAAAVAAAEGGSSSSSSSSARGSVASREAASAGLNGGSRNGSSSRNSSSSSTSSSSNLAAGLLQRLPSVSVMDLYDSLVAAALRASSSLRGGGSSSSISSPDALSGSLAGASSASASGAAPAAAEQQQPLPPRASDVPYPLPAATASASEAAAPDGSSSSHRSSSTVAASTSAATSSTGPAVLGAALLGDLGRAVKALRAGDRRLDQPDTVLRLKRVLETYTDVTRYPRPRRTDAAVIVAARDDAYVSQQSVQQLHQYWAGSELRMVSGGHVSAFLMHQDAFRAAIRDSLSRLAAPPPPPHHHHHHHHTSSRP
ncbi:hypothetical protein HXX76_013344 [Chlamydomonas incerta]|uniref:Uncharacterized protein n=1 Tax=Chlamydomonas incerta TaxID=51695 RepID=A0A835SM24_CHLIN|nr:hypothetical protein HXX76_013344 [Chlamydomonas incerta]|eukprot:KAG2425973.1 hypothetical protein HXX76_013344 [Chlamydomonas incerta]